MHIVFLLFALTFNAAANILMKLASVKNAAAVHGGLPDRIVNLFLSWPFLSGLVLFGLNLLCYTIALSKMHLSVAYPIMVGSGFAIIGITSYFLFHERLSVLQVVGTVFILIGVSLLATQPTGV
jgi:multidrug transporter EmrE-like cation transporter